MFSDCLQIRWLQLIVEGHLNTVGVKADCVSGVVALQLNYLLVKCMPCILIVVGTWKLVGVMCALELSTYQRILLIKNTERRKTA